MAAVIEEARARTRELVGLPDGESIEIEYVRDTPWLGYHEYLGDLRGRISINVDRPRSAISLLTLALHESYAGHQAERCNKEVALIRGRGLLEESIAVVTTPQPSSARGWRSSRSSCCSTVPPDLAFEAIVHEHGDRARPGACSRRAAGRRALGLAGRGRRADAARGG